MEPNQNNQNIESVSNNDVVFRDKPKKNRGVIAGMVCLALLAIGGIGFGIWAMMDGNAKVTKKNEQIAELNSRLAEDNQLPSDEVDVENDGDSVDIDAADYIYVEEWGLKIKIPGSLHMVSYEFKYYGSETQVDGTTVGVSGTVGNNLLDFANMYKNQDSLGAVSRIHKDKYSGPEYDGIESSLRECGFDGSLVFSDDKYNYCYSHPQSVHSISENEINLEVSSTELIREMLTNPDNYSKF